MLKNKQAFDIDKFGKTLRSLFTQESKWFIEWTAADLEVEWAAEFH